MGDDVNLKREPEESKTIEEPGEFARGRFSKRDAVSPEIVPVYPREYRPPKRW